MVRRATWVKCVDPQGQTIIFDSMAKAARHISAATGRYWNTYSVKQAAANDRTDNGFRLSWVKTEEVQQHERNATDTVEEISRAGDMHQIGAISSSNAQNR